MEKRVITRGLCLTGVGFMVLGVVILVFASGLRRYYSGGFFMMMGLILLVSTLYRSRQDRSNHGGCADL